MNVSSIQTTNGLVNGIQPGTSSNQVSNTSLQQQFDQMLQQTISMLLMQETSTLAGIGSFDSSSEDGLSSTDALPTDSLLTNGDSSPGFDGTSFDSSLSGLLSLLPNYISTMGNGASSFVSGASDEGGQAGNSTLGVQSASTTGNQNTVNAPANLASIVDAASSQYQLPSNLLSAVIQQESGFNPSAVSGAGAQGLMQLMPSTAAALGVTNAFDPTQNVQGGAKYLRQLLDQFNGSVPLALAAYNAGPGAVQQYGGIPPYGETQAYVNNIMKLSGRSV